MDQAKSAVMMNPRRKNLAAGRTLRSPWLQLAALFVTALLAYTDRQVLSLFVEPVQRDLHLDDVQSGLLIGTAFGCIYAITGLPMGWIADRTSRRNLLVVGAAVWTIGTLGCGLASTFPSLFAWRVIVGMGESVLSPAAVSMIGDLFPPALQGRALATYFMGIEAGAGTSLLAGGTLVGVAHTLLPIAAWRGVFLLLGAVGILLVLALLAVLREPVRTSAHHSGDMETGSGRTDLLTVGAVFAAVALMSMLENSVAAWMPTLLIRRSHVGLANTGLLLGPCLIAGGSIGVLTGGWRADRAAAQGGWRRKLTLLGPACLAYPVVTLGLLPVHVQLNLGTVLVLFVLSGFVTAVGLSTIVDLVAPNRRGFATASSFFLNVMLGAGLGPVLTALLSHLFAAARLDWSLLCLALGTMVPVGLLLMARTRVGRSVATR